MGSILIHQTIDINTISGLNDAIEELRLYSEVRFEHAEVPAVAGELAGAALDILISPPAQAILNAAGFGALLWTTIDLLRKAGKKLLISKDLAIPLVSCKAKEELGKDYSDNPDITRIWGPMEAEITDGPIASCLEEYEEALGPIGYFLAIAVSKPNNRVKTIYYLLGAGGKLCGSWSTQTLSERVPDFLRPDATP